MGDMAATERRAKAALLHERRRLSAGVVADCRITEAPSGAFVLPEATAAVFSDAPFRRPVVLRLPRVGTRIPPSAVSSRVLPRRRRGTGFPASATPPPRRPGEGRDPAFGFERAWKTGQMLQAVICVCLKGVFLSEMTGEARL